MGGGKFYVQTVNDQRIATIQQQLASLNLQEPPMIGAFKPAKGDIVLAQFSLDNSWNRALVIKIPFFFKTSLFIIDEVLQSFLNFPVHTFISLSG